MSIANGTTHYDYPQVQLTDRPTFADFNSAFADIDSKLYSLITGASTDEGDIAQLKLDVSANTTAIGQVRETANSASGKADTNAEAITLLQTGLGNTNRDVANKLYSVAIAEPYSTSATYSIGDIVVYDGQRYKCTTPVSVAEPFDADKWTGEDVETVLEAIKAMVAETGNIFDSKNVVCIAGVARYVDGAWTLLDNEGHEPLNLQMAANQTDPGGFNLVHNVGATKVLSLVATPDETLASRGVFCGASVGLNGSSVDVCVNGMAGDLVVTDANADPAVTDYAGMRPFIDSITAETHQMLGNYYQVNLKTGFSGYGAIVNSIGDYEWKILGQGTTYINVQPYLGGVKQTLPLPASKNLFSMFQREIVPTVANDVRGSSNIWILGFLEK